MASSNINKIVRGNLNFKPWIAAKNTSEIVNSYVQKFYKQIPDNFKSDLLKPKLSARTTENRVPLRKVIPEKFNIPIISNKATSKLRSNGYRSPAITRKNSFVTAPKKFLKTPNFKIYTKRRYTSSISSSKSSFVPNKSNYINEEYRRKIYKPAPKTQTYRETEGFLPSTNYYKHSVISKYIANTRLFNELKSMKKTAEASNAICNDLMSIDNVLKKRICAIKQKLPSVKPLGTLKQDLWESAFKGWNHPSTDHNNKLTITTPTRKPVKYNKGSLKSGLSSFGLMPVKRKPYLGKISNLSPVIKNENARFQSLGSSRYKEFSLMPGATRTKPNVKYQSLDFGPNGGVSAKFNDFKIAGQYSKDKSEEKCFNAKDALDIVCLNRADGSLRSRNQRGFQGSLRL